MSSNGVPQPSAVPPASSETEPIRTPHALDDRELELAVVLAVLRTLTAWESFGEGSERLLRELAGALGQMAAVLWMPQEESLVMRAIWSMPGVDGAALQHAFGRLRVPRGVGLAGRAWERREAVDRPACASPAGVSRRQRPPQGLGATLAFPCAKSEEVLGVVELYSSARPEWSGHLMQVLAYAGAGFGAFFARRRGELGLTPLSRREVEVLTLAARGLSVCRIAEALTISPATVKTHLEHIYRKLGVRDRTAAVANALRAGFIE
ncbi:MAG: two component transcriptional regulator, LuxR family [Solirubrobacterales bacterium]|nr:two component transcriptional regulator, LuxR family [Solirubrobacterales bacterium]